MNTPSAWQDEHIHALVDGELDPAMAQRLEADSRSDATLAGRIARQREITQLLRARFDPVLEEPVPPRLASTVDVVVPLDAARSARVAAAAQRPRWGFREWGAIAASLFLGLLLAPQFFRGEPGLPVQLAAGELVATGALDAALNQQHSGGADRAAPVQITLSFRASTGEPCRTFRLRSGGASAGLACRQAGRWKVQLLEDAGSGPASDDYRQAASPLTPALRSALDARGAGEALTRDEETALIARHWDAPRP